MSETYQPGCSTEFRVCRMEAGCSCPCPRHESGGSRSVGSICSATRCGAVIRQAEGDRAQWHLRNSFSPLLQTNFTGVESDNFLIPIHLILDFHHLMSGCSLIAVLSSMSVGHCLPTLIADYGSGVFYGWVVTDCLHSISIRCSHLCWSKRCSLTKIIIISNNPSVIIINCGFNGCRIKLRDFTS